ncbi:MAG: DNA mismatch repair protein MutS [Nitriliruptor sp.]|nr:MAG: DNA mismatch repair protein MutS [Nitriliruptor sp.]
METPASTDAPTTDPEASLASRTVGPSVLWPGGGVDVRLCEDPPGYFRDLNLDQLVDAAARARQEQDLAVFFHTRLQDPAEVVYRQDVCRELQRDRVRGPVDRFVEAMTRARRYRRLSAGSRWPHEGQVWLLHAARTYVQAVMDLTADLEGVDLHADGLRAVRGYLIEHVASQGFQRLEVDSRRALERLAAVQFRVHYLQPTVTVQPPDPDAGDFSERIAALFDRFRQDAAASDAPDRDRSDDPGLDHIEAQIVERVARLHPEVFADLARFADRHADHANHTIDAFDRQVQFYLAYLDLVAPLAASGLPLCYPEVAADDTALDVRDTYDLALAHEVAGQTMVLNDVTLQQLERVIVVTGANQGGKTTMARAIGQLHHLAALGLPVPGRSAQLVLCDRILTHFPRQERLGDLHGRLQDDMLRVRDLLDHAGPASLVILNETFGSTTVADARAIGTEILQRLDGVGARCVYVTFIDELAHAVTDAVSLVATVDPDDPAVRTFQLVRRPPDGRAHALAIARKHGLTYDQLQQQRPT